MFKRQKQYTPFDRLKHAFYICTKKPNFKVTRDPSPLAKDKSYHEFRVSG